MQFYLGSVPINALLSTIPHLSLCAAVAGELCVLQTALASVHAILLQRILCLGALFLFPVKDAQELISVLLLIVYALKHFWDNILPSSTL